MLANALSFRTRQRNGGDNKGGGCDGGGRGKDWIGNGGQAASAGGRSGCAGFAKETPIAFSARNLEHTIATVRRRAKSNPVGPAVCCSKSSSGSRRGESKRTRILEGSIEGCRSSEIPLVLRPASALESTSFSSPERRAAQQLQASPAAFYEGSARRDSRRGLVERWCLRVAVVAKYRASGQAPVDQSPQSREAAQEKVVARTCRRMHQSEVRYDRPKPPSRRPGPIVSWRS